MGKTRAKARQQGASYSIDPTIDPGPTSGYVQNHNTSIVC
jgi:hypothetical protein